MMGRSEVKICKQFVSHSGELYPIPVDPDVVLIIEKSYVTPNL